MKRNKRSEPTIVLSVEFGDGYRTVREYAEDLRDAGIEATRCASVYVGHVGFRVPVRQQRKLLAFVRNEMP